MDLEIFNRAPSTIRNYDEALGELPTFAGQNGWPQLQDQTKVHLIQFLTHIKNRSRWSGRKRPG